MKGDKFGRQGGSGRKEQNQGRRKLKLGRLKAEAAAKSEITKGDNLGRPGGSGSQERNHHFICNGIKKHQCTIGSKHHVNAVVNEASTLPQKN